MFECIWCGERKATSAKKDCQWIEPGGIDVVLVTDVPAIDCQSCQDVYIDDQLNAEIEQALNTVDLDKLGFRFSYDELTNAPKMNIFELYSSGASFKCP
ncbi:hypothetical protein BEP19_14265 [Ammoniphilus oxalaticus]|uniref:YgiT-type zinc finger domain-containing protein n=1 Tax=Ammoniphilus oxalaticus TaxID=66863 RepID=A0A419SEN9_9BACL|nr:YokU family protein [Ammoniphilus oxalaticus]RKD21782.1 hypothetical protein BEP19_14265 [Ammoniphilus oxalaticus]